MVSNTTKEYKIVTKLQRSESTCLKKAISVGMEIVIDGCRYTDKW